EWAILPLGFGGAWIAALHSFLARGRTVNVQLTQHLRRDRYDDFWLTDAIRPSVHRRVTPRQGFRLETYRDTNAGLKVPALVASVSREKLFDLFLDLLDPLGD